ncbi:MAG: carbohydrate ABC transporter substrate-binding protein, partial [Blautia sp.]|nr:carbohydrate ABC transporter substrate-binding protein [Blautia sp.]
MTKRLVAKLLTVAMIGSAFVGMTGTSVMAEGKPYEGVTLSVWGASTEINDTTLAIMEAATEELGMEFEIEINPGGSDGDNILKTKLAADEVPDLVNWNSGSKFLSVNPEKYFLDLTDEPMTEKFDDAFKSVVSVD